MSSRPSPSPGALSCLSNHSRLADVLKARNVSIAKTATRRDAKSRDSLDRRSWMEGRLNMLNMSYHWEFLCN